MTVCDHYIDPATGDLHTLARITIAGRNDYYCAKVDKDRHATIDYDSGTGRKRETVMLLVYQAMAYGWKPAVVEKDKDGNVTWRADEYE